MRIQVMKFGGSSFASDEHFHRVASYIQGRVAEGNKVALVVSGLPGATEALRAKCLSINPEPSGETIDCLIPLADTIGAAYCRAALERQRVKVTTLYFSQLGLLTDSNYSRARIQEFDPTPLRTALETHDVVVVPGGQARNAQGQQMWMGKNSSDLSAVAVAAALGVKDCEIYSDVCGVYSSDPNQISGTQLVPEISYDAAIDMSLSGAKVIHHGSVRYAKRHGVEIVCRLNQDDFRVGTRIGEKGAPAVLVLDQRSVVLEFAAQAEQERAVAALSAIEVPFVDMARPGESRLAVTCGFFDVERFLRENNLQPRTLDRYLASEFRRDGSVSRHLPEKSTAQAFSQQLHDQLYSQRGHLGSAA
ncbi:Aspartokinase [Cystobacter fuscus DSM 2262]|uniref:aspartate kinase n=1 Tax=Cystobacter fuscus (strain ATCC 25194 / DSM 2262 / NBRC 100088 / M29) TaxID=1242864 RepID=S9PKF3_CYSF2|nr:aspartokinase [Cystobacter fuscus]EPX63496.1 Aspartokinase [Cystobacter fuscus DSM 2262]